MNPENTLTIMQYHPVEMREILDNLRVWDSENNVFIENPITYTEVEHEWSTGGCSMFTIIALVRPLLVFYEIGRKVDEKIDAPLRAIMPKPVFTPDTIKHTKIINDIADGFRKEKT
jgi:hypothetical protein